MKTAMIVANRATTRVGGKSQIIATSININARHFLNLEWLDFIKVI